jgi:hypothetical protein
MRLTHPPLTFLQIVLILSILLLYPINAQSNVLTLAADIIKVINNDLSKIIT